MIEIIVAQAIVPVIVDAGLGAPSHVAEAFELGVDAVLVNTAIAAAADPIRMARAFCLAVESALEAVAAGLPSRADHALPTSPLTAFLEK
jgi:thiazole synthase